MSTSLQAHLPGAWASAQAGATIVNALTIDVEDYFQVSALAPYIARSDWDSRECRVERNVDALLQMLQQHRARATFFTLGWIAERYPLLVRRIVDAGHELASHGYGHQRASELDRAAYREDVVRAKRLLEDIAGTEVCGYRAPSFSIGEANRWAFEVLAETGHLYSSSIYPIRHDHYGSPDAPRFVHRLPEGLLEVPITTFAWLGRNWPAGGGGYFRLLPYAVSRWMIHQVHRRDRRGAVLYFHPWEIDPGQPRIAGADTRTRFRHYVNLHSMQRRLERLMADFRWERMDRLYLGIEPSGAAR